MMKLVSLAAVFGIGLAGVQVAANAETWHLLTKIEVGGFGLTSQVIPFSSEEECESGKLKIEADKSFTNKSKRWLTSGVCVKGK